MKTVERKIRPYLYGFIVFCAFYSLTNDWIKESVIVSVTTSFLYIVISIPIGIRMHSFIEEFFNSMDWEAYTSIKGYRRLKRTMQGVGVVFLYFYVQLGIIYVLFPDFLFLTFKNIPLFLPTVIANCYAVILFYRRLIWKPFTIADGNGTTFLQ